MGDDDLLYHYTSAAGLIGLLGTAQTKATMWLSQLQYMNDDVEFYHAFDVARTEVLNLRDECPAVRRVSSGVWGIPHEDTEMLGPIKGTVFHRLFSFSLSEVGDLLSQWRGYAPNGGYCLGYRVGELRQLASKQAMKLIRCVYDESEKQELVRKAIRKIEEGLRRGEVDLLPEQMARIPQADHAECTARVRLQNEISNLAPSFKHASFKEEREWRIVGMVVATDPRARWRAVGSDIIPYVELQIDPQSAYNLFPAEVAIGPGVDFYRAEHAIQFMNWKRYGSFEVKPSKATLRFR